MNKLHFSQDQLVRVAKLSDADMAMINEGRRPQNKLGLGYQFAFVRLFNQFPAQVPFEPLDDIVTYMSLQLDVVPDLIEHRACYSLNRAQGNCWLYLQEPFLSGKPAIRKNTQN